MRQTALDDASFEELLDELAAAAGHTVPRPDPVSSTRTTRRLPGVVAKLAALGLVAKVGLGTAVAAASVGGAGAAGLLPEGTEDIIESVVPFEFPDEVSDAIDEAERRAAELESGEFDEADAADEARRLAEQLSEDAGEESPPPTGFDPSNLPNGSEYTPPSVPSTPSQDPEDYVPEDAPGPQTGEQYREQYENSGDEYQDYEEQYRQQYGTPPTGPPGG